MIKFFKRKKVNDPVKPCGIRSTAKPDKEYTFNEVFLNAHKQLKKTIK
jgi:hypothetical protein